MQELQILEKLFIITVIRPVHQSIDVIRTIVFDVNGMTILICKIWIKNLSGW